jgi:hypothetical protein
MVGRADGFRIRDKPWKPWISRVADGYRAVDRAASAQAANNVCVRLGIFRRID